MSGDVSASSGLGGKIRRLRVLAPIMASICVIGTGNSLLTTSVSLRLSQPDMDPQAVQILLTGFPAGFLLGCLVARWPVSRLGHQRTFLLVGLLAALAAVGYLTTSAIPVWLFLRFLNGLSMAALFVVSESWINLYADQNSRGTYFSLYMLMTALAVLFGQLLVEAAGPQSPHLFLMAAVTITVGLLYCGLIGGAWPQLPARIVRDDAVAPSVEDQRYGLRKLFLLAPATVIAVFQSGMTNMNVFALTPIYGVKIGLSAETTVGLVTAFSLGGMVAQTPIGWLSDRLDRRVLLLGQGILAAALCGLIVAVGNHFAALLFGLFFAYGAVALTIYPVGIAFANSRLDSHHMVSASGGLLLLYSIGNILTPGFASSLMEHVAPHALFLLLGSGGAAVAVAAALNLRRRQMPASASIPRDCIASGANE